MMEEELIRKHDKGRNPFTTPEGYFEGFTSRLMERIEREGLKEQQTSETAQVVRLHPLRRMMRYAAAAVVTGICVGVGTYFYQRHASADTLALADATEMLFSDETLDDALDYEMDYGLVNNNQIAYYLTEAY